MLQTDRPDFDKQITVMMGGFPGYFLTPDRLESYWRGLQKMPMSSLTRVVDFVLSEDGPEKIPGVSAMWGFYRQLRARRSENQPQQDIGPSRAQLEAHLHRMAIAVAKNETMPMFKGFITRTLPERYQAEYDRKWAEWDNSLGLMDEDYWEPRAQQLIAMWRLSAPKKIDAVSALAELA